MTDLATLVVRLEAEIGKYQENLNKAVSQLKQFQSETNSILNQATARFAAFFTVEKAIAWGREILNNADHLAKFSQSTGIAVEQLSRTQYALEASGVEAGNLDTSIKKLNLSISEAAGNAKSASAIGFRQMGIDIRTTSGQLKTADQVLLDLSARFQTYADGANKGAIAQEYFGKTGEQLIPFLNQGPEGIKRLYEESDRLGNTLSANTARAAEEFNDRLQRLGTTLFSGIGNRIAKELLPVLNTLGKRWEENGRGAEILDNLARELATGLRLLVTAGTIVGNVFTAIGRAIGAVAAAIVQAIQGNFSEAGDIIADYYSDTVDQTKNAWGDIKTVWSDGSDDLLDEVKVTARRLTTEAPNLAGGVALQTAADKASEQLKKLAAQLTGQVKNFGLSEAAAIRYRIETGDLAAVVRAAGAEGQKYADTILKQADALQSLKDTKEIEDALAGVNVEILRLQGNTSEATIEEFQRKNAELFTLLRRNGNAEGEKQLGILVQLQVAQADFNDLQRQAAQISAILASTEERLRNSREAGGLTELQLQGELSKARDKAVTDLSAIAVQQEKIAKSTGSPEQLNNVRALTDEISNLRAQTDLLEKSIRNSTEQAFGTFLKDFVKDVRNAGDAFEKFINNIADMLLDLAIQGLAQQAFQGLFGSTTSTGAGGGGGGGFFGNIFGSIASAFTAGAGANGRDVIPGMAYRVNEGTPKSEWFMSGVAGRIQPAAQQGGGRMQVQQTFVIQAPKGSVSRATQLQTAAAAARGLGDANRRNN